MNETSAPIERRRPRAEWALPALIVALGLLSTLLWSTTATLRERLVTQDLDRISAARDIRLSLTTGHLWLEETLTGDVVERQLIWAHLDAAQAAASLLVHGGESTDRSSILEPLPSGQERLGAEALRLRIERLRELTRDRLTGFDRGGPTGVGSRHDQRFDGAFREATDLSERLEARFQIALRRDERRARASFLALICLWMAIVGFASFGLWHRERRSRRVEEALKRSEAQLVQVQKMDAVGRLAGGLAHDINNYVTAITSHCELVKMQIPPEDPFAAPLHAKMDVVIGTANKVSALIRRLLAFSKKQPVQPLVIGLNAVVLGMQSMLHGLIGEDIELGTALAEDLWPVRIDPAQVEQILLNLVVNAREASPRGGRVTIETANHRLDRGYLEGATVLAAGDYVLLAVSDTGMGIPAEFRDRIFEPFFTTKPGTGNGLGLATVYGIAKQNGGHVSVYSEVSKGTTFKVYLPRAEGKASVSIGMPESTRSSTEADGEAILLIEDNHELRQATEGILRAMGYEVLAAEGGQQALDLLERGAEVDLVISDVVMPGMSGRDAFDRIRELRPNLPVLFISGYTDNVILRHGLLAGEFNFLEKPFSSTKLAAKVREILDQNREAPQVHAAAS